MSRYVKADMIGCPCGYCEGSYECQKEVDEAPSIDIVRCKECKWYKQSEAFCENGNGLWQAGDECFCNYGEREGE